MGSANYWVTIYGKVFCVKCSVWRVMGCVARFR